MAASIPSIYLHIPFCTAKCDYCDFYSIPLKSAAGGQFSGQGSKRRDFINRYIDVLLAETSRRFAEEKTSLTSQTSFLDDEAAVRDSGGAVFGPDNKRGADVLCVVEKTGLVPSIYIGGGTPSLLGAEGAARLLEGLARICRLAGRPEITVEANPESADEGFLRACADRGVTRLSLGVQSFDEKARLAAGRQGRADLLPERLKAASEMFGAGLSLDLMSGLPGQNRDVLLRDIESALSFNPGHISLYALTLEEDTALFKRLLRNPARYGKAGLPSPDEADRLWLTGKEVLVQAGYEQYEVSNFALPGRRCIHNIRYWRMENWTGIGPAASGTIIDEAGGRRTSYRPRVEDFIADPASCLAVEELDRITLIKESLLMGFRYIEGPDPVLFEKRFGMTIKESIPKTLAKWEKFINKDLPKGGAALNEEGLLFLNRFLLDLFGELDR